MQYFIAFLEGIITFISPCLLPMLVLAIPFVISALIIEALGNAFNFIKRHYKVINIFCGSLLIVVGILMMTGLMGKFLAIFS